MSRSGKSVKLSLKLNLSLTRKNGMRTDGDSRSSDGGSPMSSSPPSSCVSSDGEQPQKQQHGYENGIRYSSSPEAASMVLAGCPRCLMYVMLSEDDPKCPKCKSKVLLNFLHDKTNTKMNASN